MTDMRDEPKLLLFTCEHCSYWPMAYQGARPYGGETSFACPRCSQTTVVNLRRNAEPRGRLQALAE